jgi:hypothetical protein
LPFYVSADETVIYLKRDGVSDEPRLNGWVYGGAAKKSMAGWYGNGDGDRGHRPTFRSKRCARRFFTAFEA